MKNIFLKLTISSIKYANKQNKLSFFWSIKQIISIRLLKGLIICLLLGFLTSFSIHTIAISAFSHSSTQLDSLLKQGHTLYESGEFTEAVNVWENAVLYFEKQQNKRKQALTLSYLALGYQELGKTSEADRISHSALK
ncbi:tetratricopeptide repeat protein, partial [Brunnivagina elsteri]